MRSPVNSYVIYRHTKIKFLSMYIQSNDKNYSFYHFLPVTIKKQILFISLIINKKIKSIVKTDQFLFVGLLNLFERVVFVVYIDIKSTLPIIKV